MSALSAVLMILIIVLLILISLGLFSVIRKQEILERRLSRERDLSKVNLEALGNLDRKMDSISQRTSVSLETGRELSQQMRAMNDVMGNAKRRGTFGEYQLENLIRTYLGNSPYIYSTQYHLANGKISDGAFHLPGTDRVLCIDAKFPMENYRKLAEDPEHAAEYEKELRKNVRKHIQDVAEKYINDQTLDEAVLFIPSEGLFSWICSDGADLLDFALSSHVMLVSPTTLAGVVFTLLASTRNFYRAQNLSSIERKVEALETRAETLACQSEKIRRTERQLEKQISELSRSCSRLFAEIDELAHPEDQMEIDPAEKDRSKIW